MNVKKLVGSFNSIKGSKGCVNNYILMASFCVFAMKANE